MQSYLCTTFTNILATQHIDKEPDDILVMIHHCLWNAYSCIQHTNVLNSPVSKLFKVISNPGLLSGVYILALEHIESHVQLVSMLPSEGDEEY